MGLGVLDAKFPEQILGTSLLDEDASLGISETLRASLKLDKGKNWNIVFILQSSNDVNDPLVNRIPPLEPQDINVLLKPMHNIPEWKSQSPLEFYALSPALVRVPGPMLGSSFALLAMEFNSSFAKLGWLNGIVIAMAAPSV